MKLFPLALIASLFSINAMAGSKLSSVLVIEDKARFGCQVVSAVSGYRMEELRTKAARAGANAVKLVAGNTGEKLLVAEALHCSFDE